MLQKLGRHNCTDRVAAEILRTGAAAPVTVKPGYRIQSARFQLRSKDVSFAHPIKYRRRAPDRINRV